MLMNNTAICFLSRNYQSDIYNFSLLLTKNNYDIYIILDDNNIKIKNYKKIVNIIQIDDNICKTKGYIKTSMVSFKKTPISWDKALYFFTEIETYYDFVWFLEDDVFIPNINTLKNIDHDYPISDLLSRSNGLNKTGDVSTWHWKHVVKDHQIPWACSLICACRLSRKLLNCIKTYVNKNKKMFMIEIMFNTLAYHNNLKVDTPIQLSTIEFRHKWELEDINKNYLYHPIKSFKTQQNFRQEILINKEMYPQNKLYLIQNIENKELIENFNWKFYLLNNPELQNSCLKDKKELFLHWINIGQKQGLNPVLRLNENIYWQNSICCVTNQDSDFIEESKIDKIYQKYIDKFINNFSKLDTITIDQLLNIDYKYYLFKYPDLQKKKINTEEKLITHWLSEGFKQGRKSHI